MHAVSADRQLESRVLHLLAVAIPDDDIPSFDSSLLEPLADGFNEFQIRRDAAASERIHFQSNAVAGVDQAPPGRQGSVNTMIAIEECQDGTVEQGLNAAGIHRRTRGSQQRVVRNDDP